ncbi:MAG: DsrE family protein [Desulfovibrionaceae bacterium]|nr:DsrE family protein [Desulfovibrionaceae bacterium]
MADVPVKDSLFVIWSSPDPETAHKLAFMYAHSALKKLWWGRVRLIIWGPSARLAANDEQIRQRLREMMADGVEVWACRACSDGYGLSEPLEALGIDVFHVGQAVTDMLKEGWTSLNF